MRTARRLLRNFNFYPVISRKQLILPFTAAKMNCQIYGNSLLFKHHSISVLQKLWSYPVRYSRKEQLQVRRDQLWYIGGELLSHRMKERRYRTVFINRNEKRKSTYLKINQTLHFAQFPRTGWASLATLPKGRRDPFREDQAELSGPGEDNSIPSIPHALFQSFITPESSTAFLFWYSFRNNSGNFYAILDKSLSILEIQTLQKVYLVFDALELANSCTNCTRIAAKRGITDKHIYNLFFSELLMQD